MGKDGNDETVTRPLGSEQGHTLLRAVLRDESYKRSRPRRLRVTSSPISTETFGVRKPERSP